MKKLIAFALTGFSTATLLSGCGLNFVRFDGENCGSTEESAICRFELFDVEIMAGQETELDYEFVEDMHEWFKEDVMYGPEIKYFEKIIISDEMTTVEGSDSYTMGYYVPDDLSMTIFPNNVPQSAINSWKALGGDSVYDLEFWMYTISHEYGHHSTILNLTSGLGYKSGDNYDITLSDKGASWLTQSGYTVNNNILQTDSSPIKTEWRNYSFNVGTSYNDYLWTNAEVLTRDIQNLTYSTPELLIEDNGDMKYSQGQLIDSIWRGYYNTSPYMERNGSVVESIDTSSINTTPYKDAITSTMYGLDNQVANINVTADEIMIQANTNDVVTLKNVSTGQIVEADEVVTKTNIFINEELYDSNSRQDLGYVKGFTFPKNNIKIDYEVLVNGVSVTDDSMHLNGGTDQLHDLNGSKWVEINGANNKLELAV